MPKLPDLENSLKFIKLCKHRFLRSLMTNVTSRLESNMAIEKWWIKGGFINVFNGKFFKINKPRIQGSLRSLIKISTSSFEFYMSRGLWSQITCCNWNSTWWTKVFFSWISAKTNAKSIQTRVQEFSVILLRVRHQIRNLKRFMHDKGKSSMVS